MSAVRRVLYYAHQHGSGHVRHAGRLVAAGVADVVVATAHPDAPDLLPPGAPVAALPSDVVPGHVQPARSPLHHTPVGPTIQDRFRALHEVALGVRPDVCVVDVSVEAALFLRLAGFPVVHRRMHGDRTDPAHRLVYAESDALVAHYGADLEDPAWLAEHGGRAVHLGVPDDAGRLGRRAAPTTNAATGSGTEPRGSRTVAVVAGTGGGGVAIADLDRAAAAVPDARWDVYGPVRGGRPSSPNLTLHGWAPDAGERAARADVVVVSAGHNAAVDAARSGRPVVLAPEERPFDEQRCFARAVERATGVPACAWDEPAERWAAAVDCALTEPAAADRLAADLLVSPERLPAGAARGTELAAAARR